MLRIIKNDTTFAPLMYSRFHQLRQHHGSMCSGTNWIRKACEVFVSGCWEELSIETEIEFQWAADNKKTCFTFMSISQEKKIFNNAVGLDSGYGTEWGKEGQPSSCVEPIHVLWAGITCNPLSNKNVNRRHAIENAAVNTVTEVTMNAVTDFAGSTLFNKKLRLICSENIKNFLGWSSGVESCYDSLNTKLRACRPHAFEGVHEIFASEDFSLPQTRHRVHMSHGRSDNKIDPVMQASSYASAHKPLWKLMKWQALRGSR